jgi:elongation factor 1 alpha-like protein
LSKLAQKMAAAKAAREQAALAAIGIGSVPMTAQSSGSSSGSGSGSVPRAVDEVASNDMDVDSAPPPSIEPEDPLSAFFAPLSLNHAKMPSSTVKPRKSSAFFSIITSTSRVTVETGDVTSTTNIHLPPSRDPSKLENRIKLAFEGAESPDDVVLKARQGRAGTAGMTATATVPGTAGGVAVDKVAKPNHAKKVAPAEDTKPRQKSAQTVVQDAPKAKQVLEIGKSKPNASKAKADSTATTTTNSKPKSAPPTKSTDGQGKEPPGKQGGRRPAGKGPKARGGVSTATGGAGGAGGTSFKVST